MDAIHPDDRARVLTAFKDYVLTKHLPFDEEYRIIRINDGIERLVRAFGKLSYDDAGEPIYLIGVGADVTVARSAGFLHDIGKAVDHEVEGPHALIGADILRRFGTKSAKVIHAVAAHHSDEEPHSVDPIIISSADAISSARPGARRETVESYIRRLEALESVANSFPGVERSFAIQAGREVRIIVKPEEIDDLASVRLARDIVKKIEDTLEYPGQIKVTLIRETRAVEYAR